jgi:MoaA/NifB/PqqE/SkfB family radical SAM enzyme
MNLANLRALPNLIADKLHTLPLLVLYLTDGCNSKCAMCDIWKAPRRNMEMALVERLAVSAQKLGTHMLLLSGGEAMQHPEWPRIARRFHQAGAKVWLLTNGLWLRKQAHEVSTNLDAVTVSLDAVTSELYQRIRGVDALDVVLDGIRVVSALGIPVTTRTTVMRANFREIPKIVDVALAAGARQVSFLGVDTTNPYAFGPRFEHDASIPFTGITAVKSPNGTGSNNDFGGLTEEDLPLFQAILEEMGRTHARDFSTGRIAESLTKLRRLYDYFAAPYGKTTFMPPRCNAPHISVVVNVDGTLQPCYFLPYGGDLNGQELEDVINTPAMVALRAAYRNGERRECDRCVCPLYRGPRALLRGF